MEEHPPMNNASPSDQLRRCTSRFTYPSKSTPYGGKARSAQSALTYSRASIQRSTIGRVPLLPSSCCSFVLFIHLLTEELCTGMSRPVPRPFRRAYLLDAEIRRRISASSRY